MIIVMVMMIIDNHDGDEGDDDEAQVVEKFIVREVKIVKSDFCGCPT